MNVKKNQTLSPKAKFLAHIYSKPRASNKGDTPQNASVWLNDVQWSIFPVVTNLNSR
jgi:hypothetical protein